jgi:hypothetical protein
MNVRLHQPDLVLSMHRHRLLLDRHSLALAVGLVRTHGYIRRVKQTDETDQIQQKVHDAVIYIGETETNSL